MDSFYICAYICGILAVAASETRPKRNLPLLQNIFSGISGAKTRNCRYKSLMPEFRSYNIEAQVPQYINFQDNYKISLPNADGNVNVKYLNDREKDTFVVSDNAEINQFGHRKLCFCDEKEKTANVINLKRVQKVNINNPLHYRNYLRNTNFQRHYKNFEINPIPFYKTPLYKEIEVNVRRPVNYPLYSYNRYLNRQITSENTAHANVKHPQQKYSYKQTVGDVVNTHYVDKNGDVLVTQTKKSMMQPTDKQNENKDKLQNKNIDIDIKSHHSLSDSSSTLTNINVPSKNNLGFGVDHIRSGYDSQQKYFYKQTQPGLTKSYTVDKNGDVIIETNALSNQYIGNSLHKVKNENKAVKSSLSHSKLLNLSSNINKRIESKNADETYKESVSSKDAVVKLSENPIIVKENPSFKYTQAMKDTLTVIEANNGNEVTVTIHKDKNDTKSRTSQNDYRGDVPEY